jgi:ribonuclease HII
VAAASIVAKVTRDRIMKNLHQQYPQYGFARHKGYSTPSHMSALAIHGPCPQHRMSFANVAGGRARVSPPAAMSRVLAGGEPVAGCQEDAGGQSVAVGQEQAGNGAQLSYG